MLLVGSGAALGVSLVLFAVSTYYPFSLAMLALVGLFSMAYLALTNTLLTLATPREYLGRVMSIYMLDRGLMPLGSFAGGAVAELLNAPWALGMMGGISTVLVLGGALAMPHIRRLGQGAPRTVAVIGVSCVVMAALAALGLPTLQELE